MKNDVRDLRAAIEVAGLSPADIARETGYSRQYIYDIMCGRRKGKPIRAFIEAKLSSEVIQQLREICMSVEAA